MKILPSESHVSEPENQDHPMPHAAQGQMHGHGSVMPVDSDEVKRVAVPSQELPEAAKKRLGVDQGSLAILSGPDPRDSVLVQKGFLGKIRRLAYRIIGRGDEVRAQKALVVQYMEAKATQNRLDSRDHIIAQSAITKTSSGAQQYLTEHGAPRLPSRRPIASYETEFAQRTNLDKDIVMQEHVDTQQFRHGNIEGLQSGDGSTWHALRITTDEHNQPVIEENSVVATSERAAGTSNDLNNVYVRINNTGQITITTGIIDSRKRADEFMTAIAYAIQMRQAQGHEGPVQLRISSHSLNAFGFAGVGEAGMIRRQNAMADYIDGKLIHFLRIKGIEDSLLPRGPVMSHVNRTLNGFTAVGGEEKKNHRLNEQGMATQMQWLNEDLTRLAHWTANPTGNEIIDNYRKAQETVDATLTKIRGLKEAINSEETLAIAPPMIQDKIDEREELAQEIRDLPKDTSLGERNRLERRLQALNKEIKTLTNAIKKELGPDIRQKKAELAQKQKILRTNLQQLARTMHELEDSLSLSHFPEDAQARLQVAAHLLAQQTELSKELGYPPLKPAQEVQMMLLLDKLNGAITQSNCKSSLDRNAHARASGPVIDQLLAADGPARAYDFLATFESNVTAMDQAWKTYQQQYPEGSWQDFLKSEHGSEFQDVAKFQTQMFAEMMGVCRPITAWSTGTDGGFKWHHDKKTLNPLEKNNHPLPYIPTQIFDQATNAMVTLVTTNKKGQRLFTPEGLALYAGQSQKRGA